MTPERAAPARLLETFLPQIKDTVGDFGVLDLACGSGRNARYLLRHKIPVLCADIRRTALDEISAEAAAEGTPAAVWQVDLEKPGGRPLAGKSFDVILVFNYLHRPLITGIRHCLVPGGLLLFETFTRQQAAIGRPRNPDFLLEPGELRNWFEDWEILHDFEGGDTEPRRYYASLVARKPAA